MKIICIVHRCMHNQQILREIKISACTLDNIYFCGALFNKAGASLRHSNARRVSAPPSERRALRFPPMAPRFR